MAPKTDYSHLLRDVKAILSYVHDARTAETEEMRKELLFRAGTRLVRAEAGLEAVGNIIDMMSPIAA